ncbi:MAG TPA: NAD-dependent epimerase/dehydratase family protein [Longimicrobiales bacterium]|nr:NAD-dependent epimerase/dehydratase family protein [Longimicrobiales bacterium]
MRRVLVTGAAGQIGTELVPALRKRYPDAVVAASDIRAGDPVLEDGGPFITLDVTRPEAVARCVAEHQVDTIFHLAAILSATAENDPQAAYHVNMDGLHNVLEAARRNGCAVFVPSSIAAFGPGTPPEAPQDTIQRPNTMYGVTKVAGELLCDYYQHRYGVDVRGVRYPGLISYMAPPGGGTTDYAVDIFYHAIREGEYTCFLDADTQLDMMYMPDALRAAVELMEADAGALEHRNAFNVTAMQLTPARLADEIRKHMPDFQIHYDVDPKRQAIAASWPRAIDDSAAREEWGWKPQFGLEDMVEDMLDRLGERLGAATAAS